MKKIIFFCDENMTFLTVFSKIAIPLTFSTIGSGIGFAKAISKPLKLGNDSIAPLNAILYVGICTFTGGVAGLIVGLTLDVFIF